VKTQPEHVLEQSVPQWRSHGKARAQPLVKGIVEIRELLGGGSGGPVGPNVDFGGAKRNKFVATRHASGAKNLHICFCGWDRLFHIPYENCFAAGRKGRTGEEN